MFYRFKEYIKMNLYLWINVLTVVVLLIFSFNKKVHFYTHWKTLAPVIIFVCSLFIASDIYFTDLGVWGFNMDSLTGLLFFNLPIEEVLLFFTIPFASVFVYELIKAYFSKYSSVRVSYYFSFLFTLCCFILAFVYYENTYTFSAMLGAGLLNWIVYFGFTPRWYPYFVISYLFLQLFLLLVNGLIVHLGKTMVWYNENEIIGYKLFSIPIESLFCNFMMFFSIVIVHEYLRKLWEKT